MLDILIENPWMVAVIWAAMYIFDYGSTLWLARVYDTTLHRYIVYERGVELNPNFEKEIASRKTFSPKFVILLSLIVVIILLSSLVSYYLVEFLAGALLLTWSFINSRHVRNYAYVWFLRRRPDALTGQQSYSYWFMQKTLSADALTFCLLFSMLTCLTWRLFFFAGALTCLSLALRAYRLANRKFAAPASGKAIP